MGVNLVDQLVPLNYRTVRSMFPVIRTNSIKVAIAPSAIALVVYSPLQNKSVGDLQKSKNFPGDYLSSPLALPR